MARDDKDPSAWLKKAPVRQLPAPATTATQPPKGGKDGGRAGPGPLPSPPPLPSVPGMPTVSGGTRAAPPKPAPGAIDNWLAGLNDTLGQVPATYQAPGIGATNPLTGMTVPSGIPSVAGAPKVIGPRSGWEFVGKYSPVLAKETLQILGDVMTPSTASSAQVLEEHFMPDSIGAGVPVIDAGSFAHRTIDVDSTKHPVMDVLTVVGKWIIGDLMQEIDRIPERLIWALSESGAWVHMSASPDSPSPYESALIAAAAGVDNEEFRRFLESEDERLRAQTPDSMWRLLCEGGIGWTLMLNPEGIREGAGGLVNPDTDEERTRIEQFRMDVAGGMTYGDAYKKYGEFWPQFIGETLISPDVFIGGKIQNVLFPGSYVIGKAFEVGGNVIAHDLTRFVDHVTKTSVGDWLTSLTARSKMRQLIFEAQDTWMEVGTRVLAEEGQDAGAVVTRYLSGNFDDDLFQSLSPRAQAYIQRQSTEFGSDGVRNLDNLVKRYVPELADEWGSEDVRKLFLNRSDGMAYVMARAAETRTMRILGDEGVDVTRGGVIARAFDWAAGVWKEMLLTANPAYQVANMCDNTSKSLLWGYFINPLDFHASESITRYMGDYGGYIPGLVQETQFLSELGENLQPRMASVPIPGIGKPSEIVDVWSKALGADLREKFPLLRRIAPERERPETIAMGLHEPLSRLAGVLDGANFASTVDSWGWLGNNIEGTARVQIFWGAFQREIEDVGRPATLQLAKSLDLPDTITSAIGNRSIVKSANDILALNKLVDEDTLPVRSISSLLPEGAPDLFGDYARQLDEMQQMALKMGPEDTFDRFMEEANPLLDEAAGLGRELVDASKVQRGIADWRADRLSQSAQDVLQRSQVIRDDLTLKAWTEYLADPELGPQIWPRYFDEVGEISTLSHQEVKRMIRTRSQIADPAIIKTIEKYRIEGGVGSIIPPGMSTEEWEQFGAMLLERRTEIDNAMTKVWTAFASDPSDENRILVEALVDELSSMSDEAAQQASIWRDGYFLSRRDLGEASTITPEKFRDRMNAIWYDTYFAPARKAIDGLSGRLGAVEVIEDVRPLLTMPGRQNVIIGKSQVPWDVMHAAGSGEAQVMFGTRGEHWQQAAAVLGISPDEYMARIGAGGAAEIVQPQKVLFEPDVADIDELVNWGSKGEDWRLAAEGAKKDIEMGVQHVASGTDKMDAVATYYPYGDVLNINHIVSRTPGKGVEVLEELANAAVDEGLGLTWMAYPDSRKYYDSLGFGAFRDPEGYKYRLTAQQVGEWLQGRKGAEIVGEVQEALPPVIRATNVPGQGVIIQYLGGEGIAGQMDDATTDMLRLLIANGVADDTPLYMNGELLGTIKDVYGRYVSSVSTPVPPYAPAKELLGDAMDKLKAAYDAGQMTKDEYAKALQQLVHKSQDDFNFNMSNATADKFEEQGTQVAQIVQQWRENIQQYAAEISQIAKMNAIEKAAIHDSLLKTARSWSTHVERATTFGKLEVGKILFDYSMRQNWEDILRWFAPFTTWQTRNPAMWAKLIQERPAVGIAMRRFAELSDQNRERLNLTGRFTGTAPLPGQEWLQQQGVLPEGYWAIDPRELMSISSQLQEPFASPGEEDLTGWKKWLNVAVRAPETLGITPYPWIQRPLEKAGVYGNRPGWGITGPLGRMIPSVRRWEQEQGAERVPGSDWLQNYLINREVAFMVEQGELTPEQGYEAQFNPESEVYKMVQERVQTQQDRLSQYRTMLPFSLKTATPGELTLREERANWREEPETRAAFLRGQNPAQGMYSRAVGAVSEPEWAAWATKRDAVYYKYEQMMKGIPPWHPRYKELSDAMYAEIDALGAPPERVAETGHAYEPQGLPTRDDRLFQFEQARPRAEQFADSAGNIDWEAYRAAEEEYLRVIQNVYEQSGATTPTSGEYEAFRGRYKPPEELAWNIRKGQMEGGWDRYAQLKDSGEVPQGWMPTGVPQEAQRFTEPGMMALDVSMMSPELRAWVTREATDRRSQGWSNEMIGAWLQGQGLPYDEIDNILNKEGYGPQSLGSMQGAVEAQRPWLRGQDLSSPEWGQFDKMRYEQMPGLFGADTAADTFLNNYYDSFPAQQRQLRGMFNIPEGVDVSEWARDHVTDIENRMPYGAWPWPPTPSQQERYDVEKAFASWMATGEWDPMLDQYYGNPESGKSRFWDGLSDLVLNDSVYDDPVLSAIFSSTARDILDISDQQYSSALKYLQDNMEKFVDPEAAKWQAEHPDWWELAQQEDAIVKSSSAGNLWEIYNSLPTPKAQKAWKAANPEKWEEMTDSLESGNLSKIMAPHWLYFHDHEKYMQWFGDTPPDELDIQGAMDSYRQASVDLARAQDTGASWTEDMERWFGGGETNSSKFWDYYFANKALFSDEFHDDPVVTAALASDVRALIKSDAMEPVYEEALRRLRGYFDVDAARRWSDYPELRGQANNERNQFLGQFDYDARPTDNKQAEDAWWDSRTAWMKSHPVMTYFYYYENYVKWFGDSPPNSVSPVQPAQPAAPASSPTTSSGGGGGGGSVPPLPPPPSFPPPPPPGLP